MFGKAKDDKLRISVVCYDLQKFTEDFWLRMQKVAPALAFTMYPIIWHENQRNTSLSVVNLTQTAKYLGLENGSSVPEGFMKNINLKLVFHCLKNSDVVFLFGFNGLPALMITLLAKLFRVRVILICQFLPPGYENKRRSWIRKLKSFAFKNMHMFVSQSDATYATLRDVYKIDETKIVKSVFVGVYSTFSQRAKISNANKLYQEKERKRRLIFSYVGNLHLFKGMSEIINLLRFIEENRLDLDIELFIAGPSAAKAGDVGSIEYYNSEITKIGSPIPVKLMGNLEFEELVELYKRTDVLLHPTKKDCFPKVFIEAFAFGIPIITTDAHGAIGSLIRDGENALVYAKGDQNDLYECCKALADDAKFRKKLGQQARTDVLTFCDPAVEEMRMFEILRKMSLL